MKRFRKCSWWLLLCAGLLCTPLVCGAAAGNDTAYADTWETLYAAAQSGKPRIVLTANIAFWEDEETIVIPHAVVIESAPGEHYTIDGGGRQILRIQSPEEGDTLQEESVLRSITFQNAVHVSDEQAQDENPYANGGAVYAQGALRIEQCVFVNNLADFGGAVSVDGSLYLDACTLRDNTAQYNGGAIFTQWGAVAITGSTLIGNTGTGGGGAVEVLNGDLSVKQTQIKENHASYGGGINAIECSVTLSNVQLAENTAGEYGGGLHIFGGVATLTDTTISRNTAVLEGGGLYADCDRLTLQNCIVTGNRSLVRTAGGIAVMVAMQETGLFEMDLETETALTDNLPDNLVLQ